MSYLLQAAGPLSEAAQGSTLSAPPTAPGTTPLKPTSGLNGAALVSVGLNTSLNRGGALPVHVAADLLSSAF